MQFDSNIETITRGSSVYTGALVFDAPARGEYWLVFSNSNPTTVIVARSLSDAFRSVLLWVVVGAFGGGMIIGGVVMWIVGATRPRPRQTSDVRRLGSATAMGPAAVFGPGTAMGSGAAAAVGPGSAAAGMGRSSTPASVGSAAGPVVPRAPVSGEVVAEHLGDRFVSEAAVDRVRRRVGERGVEHAPQPAIGQHPAHVLDARGRVAGAAVLGRCVHVLDARDSGHCVRETHHRDQLAVLPDPPVPFGNESVHLLRPRSGGGVGLRGELA